jgi:hypothetical protein
MESILQFRGAISGAWQTLERAEFRLPSTIDAAAKRKVGIHERRKTAI